MIPTDRILEAFNNQLKGQKMRDPHFKCPHPTAGQNGAEYVWRFGDEGIVARMRVGEAGWTVFPAKFSGVEVNNYVQDGEATTGMTPDQIEVLLKAYDPAQVTPGQTTTVVIGDDGSVNHVSGGGGTSENIAARIAASGVVSTNS